MYLLLKSTAEFVSAGITFATVRIWI